MAVFLCVNYLLVAKSSVTVQNHERKTAFQNLSVSIVG